MQPKTHTKGETQTQTQTQTPLPQPTHTTHQLLPHQKITLQYCQKTLQKYSSAILSTPIGSGKTHVASTIARSFQDQGWTPIAIVPARLRKHWKHTATLLNLTLDLYSHSQASLNQLPTPTNPHHTLWIIDEAHALRNPHTLRYQHLSKKLACGHILLITSTPIHTSTNNLLALLDLLGHIPPNPTQHTLQQHWHQRSITQQHTHPQQHTPTYKVHRKNLRWNQNHPKWRNLIGEILTTPWLSAPHTNNTLSLIQILLTHRLSSHPTALLATLQRLHRRYANSTSPQGQHLSTKTFHSIFGKTGPLQTLLPFAWPSPTPQEDSQESRRLHVDLPHLRRLIHALKTLQTHNPSFQAPGILAARWLEETLHTPKRHVLKQHPTTPAPRAIIFTQYTDSAHALSRFLQKNWRVGLVTGTDARLGRLPIDPNTLIQSFNPNTTPNNTPPCEVLICTDTLSEGHNLQKAQGLLHLDRPWNPVTLAQREGRILRLGQHSKNIEIATIHPPRWHKILDQYQIIITNQLQTRQAAASTLYSPPQTTHLSSKKPPQNPQKHPELRRLFNEVATLARLHRHAPNTSKCLQMMSEWRQFWGKYHPRAGARSRMEDALQKMHDHLEKHPQDTLDALHKLCAEVQLLIPTSQKAGPGSNKGRLG